MTCEKMNENCVCPCRCFGKSAATHQYFLPSTIITSIYCKLSTPCPWNALQMTYMTPSKTLLLWSQETCHISSTYTWKVNHSNCNWPWYGYSSCAMCQAHLEWDWWCVWDQKYKGRSSVMLSTEIDVSLTCLSICLY